MASAEMKLEISFVPSRATIVACLKMLDLWQEQNPDKHIVMVPRHGKFVYEIRKNNANHDG